MKIHPVNQNISVRIRFRFNEFIAKSPGKMNYYSSLSAEVTDDELILRKYFTRRTMATDRFYF